MSDIQEQIASTLDQHKRATGIRDMRIHCTCGWSSERGQASPEDPLLLHQAGQIAELAKQLIKMERGKP